MSTIHLSLRMEDDALARLDEESRRSGSTRSQIARALIAEGLRMRVHPGVVFRDGPGGRRPALVDGPDIWEVARLLRGGEQRYTSAEAAEIMGIRVDQVETAARYYSEFGSEVDAWLDRIDESAVREEDRWSQGRSFFRSA